MAYDEYRLATTWISAAALDAGATYLIEGFAVQSDQVSNLINPWGPPEDNETLYPANVRFGMYSDMTQWADGPYTFTWCLPYLTEGMVVYLENLIWASGIQTNQVTVKTLEHDGKFGIYQCYANKPKPNIDYKRGYKGVENYKIQFVNGTQLTTEARP